MAMFKTNELAERFRDIFTGCVGEAGVATGKQGNTIIDITYMMIQHLHVPRSISLFNIGWI